ncbi:methyl-accepting chemotaxis protein [Vibrio gazogenes]|uniref:Methyl-accepting chemotaxis protein n=1 Tax=Vibrio gazogenes DSM 21264 = NBRC 103151 TaxID=1123492 RepID=A0A1M4TZA7_VIBGA|nr:methyl-accepting chemotaxis protein [Vibrio gazogenes]USP16196.1 methyl-accepting chemotaxis protein [Vibrio gazogenes]SHE49852.1 methyl-accepting chemotaxis protein [Vibrio gazogenes DSM 21264] [Vibrio gazogenes DSM 21264 = NBRC 103151]SJN53095.1 Methyl-accepting chemotaxis protein II [Vibrio gazogenes]
MKIKLKLRSQLLLIFSLIGILPVAIVATISLMKSTAALESNALDQLISSRDVKADQIESYLNSAEKDISILSNSRDVYELFRALQVYQELEEIVSENDKFGVDNIDYKAIWKERSKNLLKYVDVLGYRDLLLLSADKGHIIYSVKKGEELGSNVKKNFDEKNPVSVLWKNVLETKRVIFQDFTPYSYRENSPRFFVGAPVFNLRGDTIAVVILELSGGVINDIMSQRSGLGETGETYLVGKDNLMRSDSHLDSTHYSVANAFANPKNNKAESIAVNAALSGETGSKLIDSYLGREVLSAYAPLRFEGATWAIVAEKSRGEAFASVSAIKLAVMFSMLITAVIIIAIGIVLSRSITNPILKMTDIVNQLASGNVRKRANIKRSDELGDMASSLDNFAEKLDTVFVSSLEKISEGDLTSNLTSNGQQDVITNALIKTNADLKSIVTDISGYTNSIVEQSNKVMLSSETILSNTASSEQSIQSISAAIVEVNEQVKITANTAREADELSQKAKQSASLGSDLVSKTVSAMNDIREASSNISSILSAIENIANQTNLLALNAAIEAARAGETGRGFAVVADEVRALAAQSTKAANETAKLIEIVVEKTQVGAEISENSSESLKEIVDSIEVVCDLMGNIAVASEEQARTIDDTSSNLNRIADKNVETTSEAKEGAGTSQKLTEMSSGLKGIVEKFTLSSESTHSGRRS